MRLEPGKLLFGVAPAILIDCAEQLCEAGGPFAADDICKALGAPMAESQPVIEAMVENGFLERQADGFIRTPKLAQLALANISTGMARAEAEALLRRVIAKAVEVNARPDIYPCAVDYLVVFGSYLTDKTVLSDLDLGVKLRSSRRVQGESKVGALRELLRRPPEAKTYAALRLRRPKVISVHAYTEVLELGTPYKLVWGCVPAG